MISNGRNKIHQTDLCHSKTLLQRSDDRMANLQRRKDAFCCRQQKIASFFANRERRRGMSCRFAQRKGLGGWKGQTGWARHSSRVLGKVRCSKSLSFIGRVANLCSDYLRGISQNYEVRKTTPGNGRSLARESNRREGGMARKGTLPLPLLFSKFIPVSRCHST